MTRQLSASAIKGSKHGVKLKVQDLPGKGTKIRALYDLFFEYKGKIVPDDKISEIYKDRHALHRGIETLCCSYGFDILKFRGYIKKPINKPRCAWAMIGEWNGKIYIDYGKPPTFKELSKGNK